MLKRHKIKHVITYNHSDQKKDLHTEIKNSSHNIVFYLNSFCKSKIVKNNVYSKQSKWQNMLSDYDITFGYLQPASGSIGLP